MDASQRGIGAMAALHILAGSDMSCLCFTSGLASGHVVFTIASLLDMWRLRLESLPTIPRLSICAMIHWAVTGGAVALY